MSHSSGLSYGIFDPGTAIFKAYNERKVLNPATTLAEMMDALTDLPLVYHPGTSWEPNATSGTEGLSQASNVVIVRFPSGFVCRTLWAGVAGESKTSQTSGTAASGEMPGGGCRRAVSRARWRASGSRPCSRVLRIRGWHRLFVHHRERPSARRPDRRLRSFFISMGSAPAETNTSRPARRSVPLVQVTDSKWLRPRLFHLFR
jgi:hypothetical protein